MAAREEIKIKERSNSERSPDKQERKLDRCLSANGQPDDDSIPVKFEIIVKPATKSRPSNVTESPIKPAPVDVRCKLAEERRRSIELQVISKCKEHEEKIMMAQKIKNESTEQRQKAIKDHHEKKFKTSEELLTLQNQEQVRKRAEAAKKLEEARKIHDELVAAKVKEAEQKLAKFAIAEEKREENLKKVREQLHEKSMKIKEGVEKVEKTEKEKAEQIRIELEQKELMAEKKRIMKMEEMQESLRKKHQIVEERLIKKREGQSSQG